MKKNHALILLLILTAVIITYLITDLINSPQKTGKKKDFTVVSSEVPTDSWYVHLTHQTEIQGLKAVAICNNGNIAAGGDSFIILYDKNFRILWQKKTGGTVTALDSRDKIIFAALRDRLDLYDLSGNYIETWGPFMPDGYITSVASNKNYIVIADAANKSVFILNNEGATAGIIGTGDERFIVPSLFFDTYIDNENNIYIANTGMKRIEKHHVNGNIVSWIGESGNSPAGFAGCCNPSHFTIHGNRYITAEKGINRIKILDADGKLVEYVSGNNNFERGIPLDIAAGDENIIYAANPADSKIYVFRRNMMEK